MSRELYAYPRAFIFARSNEVASIRTELQIRDQVRVRSLVGFDLLPRLDVPERDLPRLVTRDDGVGQSGEGDNSHFRSDGRELVKRFL